MEREREAEMEREREAEKMRDRERLMEREQRERERERGPRREWRHYSAQRDLSPNKEMRRAIEGSNGVKIDAREPTDQIMLYLYKIRDSVLSGFDGVHSEMQRRNQQVIGQFIAKEEMRSKEIDSLRGEINSLKKEVLSVQDLASRRIEASLEGLHANMMEVRQEMQELMGVHQKVDNVRGDVRIVYETLGTKLDLLVGEVKGTRQHVMQTTTQTGRLVEGIGQQLTQLQNQAAAAAVAQPPPPTAQPEAAFAGGIGKKMFPIEGLTSKIFSFEQKLEGLETSLSKQIVDLKNEVLSQKTIQGIITEEKKSSARATRKKA